MLAQSMKRGEHAILNKGECPVAITFRNASVATTFIDKIVIERNQEDVLNS